MDNNKIAKEYFKKYFKNYYIQETDNEFKSLVRILNKKDRQVEKLPISVVSTFVCDKHPNANTYTSTTGKQCCIKCAID